MARPMSYLTETRRPLAYVTGGAVALNAVMCDRCTAAHPTLDAYLAGGPIDAPEQIATGGQTAAFGVRFFTLHPRDDGAEVTL